jgi:hypothetical protein
VLEYLVVITNISVIYLSEHDISDLKQLHFDIQSLERSLDVKIVNYHGFTELADYLPCSACCMVVYTMTFVAPILDGQFVLFMSSGRNTSPSKQASKHAL